MSEKLITPQAILSYPHLFEPQAVEGGDPKYSAALIFTEEEAGSELFTAMKRAAVATATEKWGEKTKGMIREGVLRMPFRNDVENKGYDQVDGTVYINVRSKRMPGIVSSAADPQTGKPLPIENEEDIYAGCFVRASIRPFAYDVSGNKGVSFALNNIQKLGDGERLDSRVAAEDEFTADQTAAEAAPDLDDLFEN